MCQWYDPETSDLILPLPGVTKEAVRGGCEHAGEDRQPDSSN